MKKQLIITKGLPASGKTTYAKEWVAVDLQNRVLVEKDAIRQNSQLFKGGAYSHGRGDESTVIKERDRMIHKALSNGKSVICSDTNLLQKHITSMTRIAKQYDAEVIIKSFLDVPLQELIDRDLDRHYSHGEQVIRKMFHQHVKTMPTFLKYDANLPSVVVCDIDGTLTKGPKDRSPYDWHKVGQDDINLGVAHLLDGVKLLGTYRILMMSGRDSTCRPETEEWLERHDIEYDELYMRAEDDKRPDTAVKSEMVEKYIRDRYNVLIWFDDRIAISTALRDVYGINVAQMGDTRYEF